jgi:hypothetical protein
VLDRSASMLDPGGGAVGLAPAVVQFLDFFDTSSDTIGIVSFGSSARLEVPMTTNFIIAATNNLIDGYATNLTISGLNCPGVDPESVAANGTPPYQTYYTTTGIRRLKFGGQTAADDGIRMGLEQMMANPGFNDPDVVKYMVIFTDGKWNASRTLFAAPGYTNEITCPSPGVHVGFVTNALSQAMTNGQYTGGNQGGGPWDIYLANDTNLLPVPSMGLVNSSLPNATNAMTKSDQVVSGTPNSFEALVNDHTNDYWQSVDSSGYEPFNNPSTAATIGAAVKVTNPSYVSTANGTNYYTHNLDIWLTPGSTAYYYTNAASSTLTSVYVSDYTNPTKHMNFKLNSGGKIDLVVPGYITDGLWYDGLDLPFPDNSNNYPPTATYPKYRANNYQEAFMWPDETTNAPPIVSPYYSTSLMRQLMFRNYPNLLTGFYIYRADDPTAPYVASRTAGQQGIEPLITDQTNSAGAVGAARPLYGLGCYYPSAGFYWPFGGDANALGYVTNAVGVDYYQTFALPNPTSDPDPNHSYADNGGSRHIAYSINMLSTNAAPEWFGELFYNSVNGGGVNVISGNSTTSASQLMQSADWQVGAPAFMGPLEVDMYSEPNHNANIVGAPSVWRPQSFNGSNFPTSLNAILNGTAPSSTGGFVSDGNGHYYANTMAWSGRPTHYYDFSQSSWEPIANNHVKNIQALPLGNWKAQEYAWHARALGVTIYTVGYGQYVTSVQTAILAQIANSTNQISPITAGSSTFVTNVNSYNPSQPIGEQFYATTAAQISNDFYSIGQAINAALTQ